jgi:hypothetical protein
MVDITMVKERLQRFFNPASIGLLYSKTHLNMLNGVKTVKKQEEFQEGMRCLCKVSWKLKFLIVGN